MDTDDLDLPRPVLTPVDLQSMSVDDLRAYIASLENEIARADKMIESKLAHRSGAESLFS
ncbi:MAG: DUF1192 domain-containing protein [Bdellovibrionales bacterium]